MFYMEFRKGPTAISLMDGTAKALSALHRRDQLSRMAADIVHPPLQQWDLDCTTVVLDNVDGWSKLSQHLAAMSTLAPPGFVSQSVALQSAEAALRQQAVILAEALTKQAACVGRQYEVSLVEALSCVAERQKIFAANEVPVIQTARKSG